MRVEILRDVMISGEPAKAGSFVELEYATANLLVGMNKAAYAPKPAPEPEEKIETKPVEAPAVCTPKPVYRRGRTTSSTSKD
jgi:hypothetical protein